MVSRSKFAFYDWNAGLLYRSEINQSVVHIDRDVPSPTDL